MFPARFTAQDENAQDHTNGSIPSNLSAYLPADLPHDNKAPSWLKCLLNDVGFGILILDPELRVCFCNDSARVALMGAGFESLLRSHTEIDSDDLEPSKDRADIKKFVSCAKLAVKGQRKLILLGEGENQVAAALSPINLGAEYSQHGVLVTTERKTVCETISLWAYGRVQGLTAGELKVLDFLANGQEPKEVASSLKISVTTVRTHIKSIISKTESSSLRDLLLRVARLPPIRTLPCCTLE
jgi:DNA-binding CsgD family transcriptional regulator